MNFLSPEHLGALADKIWAIVVAFVPGALAAIIILVVATVLARRAGQGIAKVLNRAGHVDPTLSFAVAEFIRYGIIIFAVVAALDQVGVRTTSLLAVLGAAGLAVGLALQGTLSNIAAGLMLLWLRPFHIGDYIEVNNVPGLAGTVRQTGLFACKMEAFDGLQLFVPNSALWNVPLRNYTQNAGRLVSLSITIPQKVDMNAARKALLDLATGEKRVARTPAPVVFPDKFTADTIVLNFRVWAEHAHIGALQRDLVEAVEKTVATLAGDAGPVQVTRNTPAENDPTRLTEDGGPPIPIYGRPQR